MLGDKLYAMADALISQDEGGTMLAVTFGVATYFYGIPNLRVIPIPHIKLSPIQLKLTSGHGYYAYDIEAMFFYLPE